MPSSLSAAAPLPGRHNPRWAVAQRAADALRDKHAATLQAIGVHGSMAHGDDNEASDVNLVAVTRWPRSGPAPGARRVDGVIIDVSVIGADEYLCHARTITTSWPLVADRYITTKALHDPDGWLPRLRDAHLSRLAEADDAVFSALARDVWCKAASTQARARLMFRTEAAIPVLSQSRLDVAVVAGLLTRTYFRNTAEAVRMAGVAAAHVLELGERLSDQAAQLAQRGYPVDTDVTDLIR